MFHTFETCAKHARNVRNALRESRETCAKHVRNIANHRESANHQRISRNTAKHRETCAKLARNVRIALRESRETSRNMRETCAKRRVPRVTYWPSIGIRPHALPCQPFSRRQSAKRYVLTHIRVHQPIKHILYKTRSLGYLSLGLDISLVR